MQEDALLKVIEEYFAEHPETDLDALQGKITDKYKEVRATHILPYKPIEVKRHSETSEGYEAEVTQVKSRSLQDADLTDD